MPRNKNIELYKYIGKKLKKKRIEVKLSQEKIAEKLDVDYRQIYYYETGKSKIPLDNLLKLCEFFNVDIYYFLGDIKKEKQENLSVINYPDNPELEKIIVTVKEVYEFGDDDLILGVNNCVNSMQAILKKRKDERRNSNPVKKKRLAGNNK
jgi:transcriptional regulator with XRE-family HTH domain